MVKCIKVILKDAQDVKNFLMGERVLDSRYSVRKSGGHILFPVNCKEGVDVLCENFKSAKVVDAILKKRRSNKSFKEQVSSGLSKDEIAALRRAFDIVGSIAIIEVPDELKSKQKLLASTILDLQKNVDTVLKKAGIHGTRFRTQPMTYLAGRRTKETVHREHGVFINLDVEKVYFSPRLSTERMRIAQQVKPGESVLVMFSGCAPYPCVISKNTKAKDIVGIEINPTGHSYGLKNIALNKIENVKLFKGDVKKVIPKLKKKFDRVVMPLPKSADDFLETAFSAAKKGAVIHFYAFEEQGSFDKARKRIKKACEESGTSCRILRTVKCGQHAPRTYRICVDFRMV